MLQSTARLLKNIKTARKLTGKSYYSQLIEIIKFRHSFVKLTPSEYYDFRLFDEDKLKSPGDEFIGWRSIMKLNSLFNDERWDAISYDKLIFSLICKSGNIPVPEIYAVFDPQNRNLGSIPVYSQLPELESFLKKDIKYPWFGKPSHGNKGFGAVLATAFNEKKQTLIRKGGDEVLLQEFIRQINTPSGLGYMFQESLTSPDEMISLVGETLAGVRVLLLNNCGKVQILNATWKIPESKNWTDHFTDGIYGNMAAPIDCETGKVGEVIRGIGFNRLILQKHPETHQQLAGISMPYWKEVKEYCEKAARLFPKIHLQHWDIALTNREPVGVEMNYDGEVSIHQYCNNKGVYNDILKSAQNNLC